MFDSLTLVWPVQVDAGTDTGTLQAILEAETGLPVEQQAVYHNGKLLPSRYGAVSLLSVTAQLLVTGCRLFSLLCFGSGTLQAAQVQDNDLLMLQPRPAAHVQPQQAQQTQPMARSRDGSLQNPQAFLDSCLSNPATMAQLPPSLRDAVSSGDIDSVQSVFRQFQREAEQRNMEAQLIRPGEDPMDLEVQVCIFRLVALNTNCGHCFAALCSILPSAKHRKLLICLLQSSLMMHLLFAGQDCRVHSAEKCRREF